jgi:hypothetical protein
MSDVTAQWPVVQTDAGSVTLASIPDLQSRATQWRAWAATAKANAQSLRDQAADRLATAGATLVTNSSKWSVPDDLHPKIEQARSLTEQVAAGDRSAAALKDQEASAGVFGRLGVKHHEHQVERDRGQAATQLRNLLIPIARSAPASTFAEADDQRKTAADLETQASGLDAQIQAAQGWASGLDGEVARRKEAIKAMGFDSLYEAAVLQTLEPSRLMHRWSSRLASRRICRFLPRWPEWSQGRIIRAAAAGLAFQSVTPGSDTGLEPSGVNLSISNR